MKVHYLFSIVYLLIASLILLLYLLILSRVYYLLTFKVIFIIFLFCITDCICPFLFKYHCIAMSNLLFLHFRTIILYCINRRINFYHVFTLKVLKIIEKKFNCSVDTDCNYIINGIVSKSIGKVVIINSVYYILNMGYILSKHYVKERPKINTNGMIYKTLRKDNIYY